MDAWIAGGVFVIAYALVATERFDRFRWLGVRSAQLSRGNPVRLLIALSLRPCCCSAGWMSMRPCAASSG